MKPLVSIVMPVYNLETYVGDSIKSIQRQTFGDWELVVVDDGSTDQTEEIIAGFAGEDSRIRYFRRERAGVSGARNFGLDLAKGDYITFLDGDDLWDPHFLAKGLERLAQTSGDFVFARYNRLMPDQSIRPVNSRIEVGVDSGMAIIRFLNRDMVLIMGQFIVARSLVDGLRFTEGCRIGEDTEFIFKLLSRAGKTSFIDEALMSYRHRAMSVTTQTWDWSIRIDGIRALERCGEYFRRHYHGPRRDEIIDLSEKLVSYEIFRFQYRLVKYGYYEEARNLLKDERWTQALQLIVREGRFWEKVKARIVATDRKHVWPCLTALYSVRPGNGRRRKAIKAVS